MTAYQASMRVWRGDETGGGLQDYTVEVNDGEVVLDIIHRLQATQAPDLAVRWNCKAGKCGSCSAEVNGKPRLMCMTRMSTFDPSDTVTVTPLDDSSSTVRFNLRERLEQTFALAESRWQMHEWQVQRHLLPVQSGLHDIHLDQLKPASTLGILVIPAQGAQQRWQQAEFDVIRQADAKGHGADGRVEIVGQAQGR